MVGYEKVFEDLSLTKNDYIMVYGGRVKSIIRARDNIYLSRGMARDTYFTMMQSYPLIVFSDYLKSKLDTEGCCIITRKFAKKPGHTPIILFHFPDDIQAYRLCKDYFRSLNSEGYTIDNENSVLNTFHYKKMTFPLEVELKRNDKGNLYTSLNLDPDRFGKKSKGKIAYPDFKWTDAREGKALVEISKETKRNIFLTGTML